MKILITGATGFLGRRLCLRLSQDGHQLVVLTRNPARSKDLISVPHEAVKWDTQADPSLLTFQPSFRDIEVVLSFAGESIAAKRWSFEQKKKIYQSRVQASERLFAQLAKMGVKPRVLISASAVGYYGTLDQSVHAEASQSGQDFLAQICQAWEKTVWNSPFSDARQLVLRFGMILGTKGGALPKLVTVFKLGLGGKLGKGKQGMSWIHINDAIEAIRFCLNSDKLSGPINVCAPQLVTNAQFTEALGAVLRRPTFFTVPGIVLRIAVGEMADMLLGGQKVVPQKLLASGFKFQFPDLKPALENLLSDKE